MGMSRKGGAIMGIKYDKLVRDKIPEIIEQSGKKAIIKQLDDKSYSIKLNEKLREEMQEYYDSGRIEELADIVEVIYAILDFNKVSVSQFEKIRQNKRNKGAFKSIT